MIYLTEKKSLVWKIINLGLKKYYVLMVLWQRAKFPTKRRSHSSISESMFPIKLSCRVVGPNVQVFISVYLDTVDGRCISDVVYSYRFLNTWPWCDWVLRKEGSTSLSKSIYLRWRRAMAGYGDHIVGSRIDIGLQIGPSDFRVC